MDLTSSSNGGISADLKESFDPDQILLEDCDPLSNISDDLMILENSDNTLVDPISHINDNISQDYGILKENQISQDKVSDQPLPDCPLKNLMNQQFMGIQTIIQYGYTGADSNQIHDLNQGLSANHNEQSWHDFLSDHNFHNSISCENSDINSDYLDNSMIREIQNNDESKVSVACHQLNKTEPEHNIVGTSKRDKDTEGTDYISAKCMMTRYIPWIDNSLFKKTDKQLKLQSNEFKYLLKDGTNNEDIEILKLDRIIGSYDLEDSECESEDQDQVSAVNREGLYYILANYKEIMYNRPSHKGDIISGDFN
ncbi:MAG: hypothetical protein MHMPM18_001806 [Marteilia pararefringens]